MRLELDKRRNGLRIGTTMKKTQMPRAVVITGCSSGIGRATALHLSRLGYLVLATVRKESDADSLRREAGDSELVPIFPLDLTRPEEIAAALSAMRRELESRRVEGLYALINNAGSGAIAPVELMEPELLRRELEARLVGPVSLLQGLLPQLRLGKGRILWVTTPALLPIPFIASIHVPDFGANGLIRTLAVELKPWRIPTIMIRCGGIRTAAVERSARDLEAALRTWPKERLALYVERLRKEQRELSKFDSKRTEPQRVAETVAKALAARRPRRRYRVGHLSGFAAFLEALPQGFVDWVMARRG